MLLNGFRYSESELGEIADALLAYDLAFRATPRDLIMRMPDGKDQYMVVGTGFLVVQKERTTVLARSAERPEEIDVVRARRAKERAEERLQKASDIDMARAQASLQRALARLKVAEYAVAAK